jgi:acetate kinase
MKVLAVNCGSSTLKFDLLEPGEEAEGVPRRLASGLVDRIGGEAALKFGRDGGHEHVESTSVPDHAVATRRVLDWLGTEGMLGADGPGAVGHRVVHGGDRFMEPVVIDEAIMSVLEELTELAPLHNGPALAAIRAAHEAFGSDVPMVATFDTAFHRTMPERAARYAIPAELAEKHHIRRYGFHGLAHSAMASGYAALTAAPLERTKLITLQLGNGCSATAVAGGRSVETSMGFTPLEGLVMGSRSGDADPSLIGYIARKEGVPAQQIEDVFNRQSGLLGVSGRSRDMRELLEAEAAGDAGAALAIEMFCYRVRKYLAAYLGVLGGADAVIFGGGIGENAAPIRARVCAGMEWCGLVLDEERNAATRGRADRISRDGARLHAYVIPVDEAAIIARDTVHCLRRGL